MRIIIKDTTSGANLTGSRAMISEVTDDLAVTATEVIELFYRAMLGFGYQKESIIPAMETVIEEYTDG